MPTLLKGDMKHDYGRDPFKGIIKVVETPGLAQMLAFGMLESHRSGTPEHSIGVKLSFRSDRSCDK